MNSNNLLSGVLQALFHLTTFGKWSFLTLISPLSADGVYFRPHWVPIQSLWISLACEDIPHFPQGATSFFFFFLSNQNYSGITEKWNQDPLKTMDIVPLKPRILNTLLLLIVWYAVPTTQSHHFQWGFKSFGNGFGKQSRILCFYHFLFLYETNSKQYFWMPHCMTR